MKLDKKFYGQIFKVKNNELVPEDEYVVFLAKDNAFIVALERYLEVCRYLNCDDEQITQTELLIKHVNQWRVEHPERCKNPDAKGETLWISNDWER
jgi:hypothetical protein